MLKKQNGKCYICGKKETYKYKYKIRDLSVDHNHKTGKIRALLCTKCNNMLGMADDNPFILIKAAKYLLEFKKEVWD